MNIPIHMVGKGPARAVTSSMKHAVSQIQAYTAAKEYISFFISTFIYVEKNWKEKNNRVQGDARCKESMH